MPVNIEFLSGFVPPSPSLPPPPLPNSIWGIEIDLNNSNPNNPVFTDNGQATTFGERPCMLKNGVVQYYLNPNNFAQRENGLPADITSGNDGDVMIEIPKLAYMIYTSGTKLLVKVSNNPNIKSLDSRFCHYGHTIDSDGDCPYIYVGAYMASNVGTTLMASLSGKALTGQLAWADSRTRTQNKGAGYDLFTFHTMTLLQAMYCVKYRNLNSYATLGHGYQPEWGVSYDTGESNERGMYFGGARGVSHMKFAGIEDLWGGHNYWMDGCIANSGNNIALAFKDFNNSGSGYSNEGHTVGTFQNINIKNVIGNNKCGFIPADSASGSDSTYFCSLGTRNGVTRATIGGRDLGGIFGFHLHTIPGQSAGYVSYGSRFIFRKKG